MRHLFALLTVHCNLLKHLNCWVLVKSTFLRFTHVLGGGLLSQLSQSHDLRGPWWQNWWTTWLSRNSLHCHRLRLNLNFFMLACMFRNTGCFFHYLLHLVTHAARLNFRVVRVFKLADLTPPFTFRGTTTNFDTSTRDRLTMFFFFFDQWLLLRFNDTLGWPCSLSPIG